MKIIIPSKQRADKITARTLRWFPGAIVCVDETEESEYEKTGARLLTHPSLPNLPKIINWICANEEIHGRQFAIVDDDLLSVWSIVREKPQKIDDPKDIMAIVENCAIMATGFGAKLWGFSVNRRPDSNYAYRPFCLNGRIGSFRGISDRAMREDERFRRHDDVDLTLQRLQKDRIVFRDDRFNFVFAPIYKTPGGNYDIHRQTTEREEMELLKQKWGKNVFFVRSPHHLNETRLNVER
jgi:hypothetical protein